MPFGMVALLNTFMVALLNTKGINIQYKNKKLFVDKVCVAKKLINVKNMFKLNKNKNQYNITRQGVKQ